MSITFCSGDLFLSRAQTLAHGCNCEGRMGAGIAVEFKNRYQSMYREYKRRCSSGEFSPGGVYLEKGTVPWILSLATHDTIGCAKTEYVMQSLLWIAQNQTTEGITSLALPRIGAGLGRLVWSDVRRIIVAVLGPS